jgi:hypothetical protein
MKGMKGMGESVQCAKCRVQEKTGQHPDSNAFSKPTYSFVCALSPIHRYPDTFRRNMPFPLPIARCLSLSPVSPLSLLNPAEFDLICAQCSGGQFLARSLSCSVLKSEGFNALRPSPCALPFPDTGDAKTRWHRHAFPWQGKAIQGIFKLSNPEYSFCEYILGIMPERNNHT